MAILQVERWAICHAGHPAKSMHARIVPERSYRIHRVMSEDSWWIWMQSPDQLSWQKHMPVDRQQRNIDELQWYDWACASLQHAGTRWKVEGLDHPTDLAYPVQDGDLSTSRFSGVPVVINVELERNWWPGRMWTQEDWALSRWSLLEANGDG